MHDKIRASHKVRHSREQLPVGLIVPGLHMSTLIQHAGKHTILIDGSILHTSSSSPNYLLLLLETFVQKIDLHGETEFLHVSVEVLKVYVIYNWFVVYWYAQLVSQNSRKRGLARTNETRDSNEQPLQRSFVKIKARC